MTNKLQDKESSNEGFRNEATRQRWDLFHRAIAHAKQSNVNALLEEYVQSEDIVRRSPFQSTSG